MFVCVEWYNQTLNTSRKYYIGTMEIVFFLVLLWMRNDNAVYVLLSRQN